MKLHLWLIGVCVLGLTCSCANTAIKMVDDRTFVSVSDPSLQIELAPDYVHKDDTGRRYRFEFTNEEEGRYILIQYFQRPNNERSVDYYYNPTTWIFYEIPDCEDIDKGEVELFDRTWYFRDFIHHESSASCSMIRDMGHFTRRHAVLKVLYLQNLPPHKCRSWKGMGQLNPEQQAFRERFLTNHQNDVRMSVYTPPPK